MGNNDTKFSPVNILNRSYDPGLDVLVFEQIGADGVLKNPATEETLQKVSDKIPTYDLYISYNADGTTNTKIWKLAGTSTVVKTLTYVYTSGNLTSKILS